MYRITIRRLATAIVFTGVFSITIPAQAAGEGWSLVPYMGVSQLAAPSPTITGSDDIVDGGLDIAVDTGFTAGIGLRYDYEYSRWTSEIGWEYRSNDSKSTAADGTVLPDGNYASNIFYLNGRYALSNGKRWTPWVGGGLTWIQEIDLDSNNADTERSFSESGSVGIQVMAGVDYNLSDHFYLTSELRYARHGSLDLTNEESDSRITDIDYNPLTLGLGVGIRF